MTPRFFDSRGHDNIRSNILHDVPDFTLRDKLCLSVKWSRVHPVTILSKIVFLLSIERGSPILRKVKPFVLLQSETEYEPSLLLLRPTPTKIGTNRVLWRRDGSVSKQGFDPFFLSVVGPSFPSRRRRCPFERNLWSLTPYTPLTVPT